MTTNKPYSRVMRLSKLRLCPLPEIIDPLRHNRCNAFTPVVMYPLERLLDLFAGIVMGRGDAILRFRVEQAINIVTVFLLTR